MKYGYLWLARALIGLLFTALPLLSHARSTVTVEIVGENLDDVLTSNIRLYLGIERQKNSELLNDSQIQRLHRAAPGEIESSLQPFGYYRPDIKSSLLKEQENGWRARYEVNPGEPLLIDVVDFVLNGEAATDPLFTGLIDSSLPAPGNRFSHIEYEDFKSALVDLATEYGYFQGAFTLQRVEIDRQANAAKIFLHYDSGPRFRFGDLEIDQSPLDDSLVADYATFQPGDYYELDQLLDFQQALNESRYFRSVEVAPGALQDTGSVVPVEVGLLPRADHLFKIGLGYGTDTGVRSRFGWEMPRINPRGHHFDTELKVSEIGHELYANYRIPVLNPRTDRLTFSAGEQVERFESGLSNKRSLGSSLLHGRGAWRETLSLQYEVETYQIDNESFSSELLIPGISWSRTWGSGFIDVLDGIRLDFSVRASDSSVISDTDFSRYQSAIKFITSFGERDRIIARGSLGTLETTDFEKIPSSLRFYAGGANSVRGYAYHSLGPADDDGDAIGGRNLMVGSIEYEHFFSDRWGMALFVDAGNALDNFDEPLEQGAGFGFRWKSPVGLIRVDLASAISTDNGWRLHLNIGPDL